MKCQQCGSKTLVVNTIQQPGGIRRQRKCDSCKNNAYSAEVWIAGNVQVGKSIYTNDEAALIKKKGVDVRRANEDRRKEDAL
jgi:transcriptional regulator NrdR family protein